VHKAIKGLRNLKVKIPIDKSQRRKGQTIDFSSKRHLSNPHSKNSGSKIELV